MELTPPRSRLPEGFDALLGGRDYVTPAPWEWHEEGERVVLRPRPGLHPIQWVTGLVLVPAFCCGFYWFLADTQDGGGLVFLTVMCVLIPVFVMAGFLGFHWLQQKRGPWIDFDRGSQTLRLPRVRVELPADEVHLVQVVSGVLNQGGSNPTRVTEVNVIVLRDPEDPERSTAKRYPVVGTHDGPTSREVARRLKELLGKIQESESESAGS